MPWKVPPHRPPGWAPRAERYREEDAARGNRHERGYGKAWVRLRSAVLARDPRCVPCKMVANETHWATDVDHRLPKAMKGSDAEVNLWGCCAWFHRAKTAHERAMIRRGEVSANAEEHLAKVLPLVFRGRGDRGAGGGGPEA